MCALHAGQFVGGQGPRDCLYRCSTGTSTSQTTWRATNPGRKPTQFTYPLCPRERPYQGTAASVAAHKREVHPEEENSLLKKLGRPLQTTHRSNRYGVCYKCGDLHTNLSRHSSGCDRTPPDTIPPHSDGLGGESSARNPATPSTPAVEGSNPNEKSSPSILLLWGIEGVGPMLDALDGTSLARMFRSTAKAVRQEHRMPFARSLRHALRICSSSSQCSTGGPSRRPPQRGPRH